jgi:predicted nucleic acid-binding protein
MGEGAGDGLGRRDASPGTRATGFVDTNVLIRHLIGDPPDQAAAATAFIANAEALCLPDLIVAEIVFVLGRFYKVPRTEIANLLRSIVVANQIVVTDVDLLLRAIEVYEFQRIGFPDAYLVANAERSGIGVVVSFDRGIDRAKTVRRIEPPKVSS